MATRSVLEPLPGLPTKERLIKQPLNRPHAVRGMPGGPGRIAPPFLEVRRPRGEAVVSQPAPPSDLRALPARPAPIAKPAVITSNLPVLKQSEQPANTGVTTVVSPPLEEPSPLEPIPPSRSNPLLPEGTTSVPLSALGGLLERWLAQPSRFDLPAVRDAFKFLSSELERQGERAASAADIEAAKRGVFFGTPGLSLRESAREPFRRASGDLATSLLLEQARTGGQDFARAIDQAMRFGENALRSEQFLAQLALQMLGLGFGGSPDISTLSTALGGLPLPSSGSNSDAILQALRSLAMNLDFSRDQGLPDRLGRPVTSPPLV